MDKYSVPRFTKQENIWNAIQENKDMVFLVNVKYPYLKGWYDKDKVVKIPSSIGTQEIIGEVVLSDEQEATMQELSDQGQAFERGTERELPPTYGKIVSVDIVKKKKPSKKKGKK